MINFRESFERVSRDVPEYGKEFYEDHKNLKPRVFIRQAAGTLFNEYAIERWGTDDKGIFIKFK
ncbi:hypothetical protein JHL18_02495 [Clostridium sp. YIM B02505]|uniref:Uncharacterized protein n=1 Tax=Clostridium yunnanense TaxID=2800325 RepID=A0ABS1EJG8_9CLOT|nr:hypothetical protein [Clostridium yunnanense]MBK1809514.1 hypothetical protein [Clostridium yunnanense]